MPLPQWLHCNLCFERQARSWHIAPCGKIVCQSCVQSLKTTHCGDCKAPCSRTIELNSKAPKDVQRLFGDVTAEIKNISKVVNFQDTQKAKFLEMQRKNNERLDKERAEMRRVKKNKLAQIEEAKAELAAVKEEIKKKKAILKSNDAKAKNHQPPGFMGDNVEMRSDSLFRSVVPPAPNDFLFSSPKSDIGRPQFFTSTPVHQQTQTVNRSLDGDFMKLKTPAAWHRQGTRRKTGEADRGSLDRTRTEVKSPVERMLDNLLGEYIFAFFLNSSNQT